MGGGSSKPSASLGRPKGHEPVRLVQISSFDECLPLLIEPAADAALGATSDDQLTGTRDAARLFHLHYARQAEINRAVFVSENQRYRQAMQQWEAAGRIEGQEPADHRMKVPAYAMVESAKAHLRRLEERGGELLTLREALIFARLSGLALRERSSDPFEFLTVKGGTAKLREARAAQEPTGTLDDLINNDRDARQLARWRHVDTMSRKAVSDNPDATAHIRWTAVAELMLAAGVTHVQVAGGVRSDESQGAPSEVVMSSLDVALLAVLGLPYGYAPSWIVLGRAMRQLGTDRVSLGLRTFSRAECFGYALAHDALCWQAWTAAAHALGPMEHLNDRYQLVLRALALNPDNVLLWLHVLDNTLPRTTRRADTDGTALLPSIAVLRHCEVALPDALKLSSSWRCTAERDGIVGDEGVRENFLVLPFQSSDPFRFGLTRLDAITAALNIALLPYAHVAGIASWDAYQAHLFRWFDRFEMEGNSHTPDEILPPQRPSTDEALSKSAPPTFSSPSAELRSLIGRLYLEAALELAQSSTSNGRLLHRSELVNPRRVYDVIAPNRTDAEKLAIEAAKHSLAESGDVTAELNTFVRFGGHSGDESSFLEAVESARAIEGIAANELEAGIERPIVRFPRLPSPIVTRSTHVDSSGLAPEFLDVDLESTTGSFLEAVATRTAIALLPAALPVSQNIATFAATQSHVTKNIGAEEMLVLSESPFRFVHRSVQRAVLRAGVPCSLPFGDTHNLFAAFANLVTRSDPAIYNELPEPELLSTTDCLMRAVQFDRRLSETAAWCEGMGNALAGAVRSLFVPLPTVLCPDCLRAGPEDAYPSATRPVRLGAPVPPAIQGLASIQRLGDEVRDLRYLDLEHAVFAACPLFRDSGGEEVGLFDMLRTAVVPGLVEPSRRRSSDHDLPAKFAELWHLIGDAVVLRRQRAPSSDGGFDGFEFSAQRAGSKVRSRLSATNLYLLAIKALIDPVRRDKQRDQPDYLANLDRDAALRARAWCCEPWDPTVTEAPPDEALTAGDQRQLLVLWVKLELELTLAFEQGVEPSVRDNDFQFPIDRRRCLMEALLIDPTLRVLWCRLATLTLVEGRGTTNACVPSIAHEAAGKADGSREVACRLWAGFDRVHRIDRRIGPDNVTAAYVTAFAAFCDPTPANCLSAAILCTTHGGADFSPAECVNNRFAVAVTACDCPSPFSYSVESDETLWLAAASTLDNSYPATLNHFSVPTPFSDIPQTALRAYQGLRRQADDPAGPHPLRLYLRHACAAPSASVDLAGCLYWSPWSAFTACRAAAATFDSLCARVRSLRTDSVGDTLWTIQQIDLPPNMVDELAACRDELRNARSAVLDRVATPNFMRTENLVTPGPPCTDPTAQRLAHRASIAFVQRWLFGLSVRIVLMHVWTCLARTPSRDVPGTSSPTRAVGPAAARNTNCNKHTRFVVPASTTDAASHDAKAPAEALRQDCSFMFEAALRYPRDDWDSTTGTSTTPSFTHFGGRSAHTGPEAAICLAAEIIALLPESLVPKYPQFKLSGAIRRDARVVAADHLASAAAAKLGRPARSIVLQVPPSAQLPFLDKPAARPIPADHQTRPSSVGGTNVHGSHGADNSEIRIPPAAGVTLRWCAALVAVMRLCGWTSFSLPERAGKGRLATFRHRLYQAGIDDAWEDTASEFLPRQAVCGWPPPPPQRTSAVWFRLAQIAPLMDLTRSLRPATFTLASLLDSGTEKGDSERPAVDDVEVDAAEDVEVPQGDGADPDLHVGHVVVRAAPLPKPADQLNTALSAALQALAAWPSSANYPFDAPDDLLCAVAELLGRKVLRLRRTVLDEDVVWHLHAPLPLGHLHSGQHSAHECTHVLNAIAVLLHVAGKHVLSNSAAFSVVLVDRRATEFRRCLARILTLGAEQLLSGTSDIGCEVPDGSPADKLVRHITDRDTISRRDARNGRGPLPLHNFLKSLCAAVNNALGREPNDLGGAAEARIAGLFAATALSACCDVVRVHNTTILSGRFIDLASTALGPDAKFQEALAVAQDLKYNNHDSRSPVGRSFVEAVKTRISSLAEGSAKLENVAFTRDHGLAVFGSISSWSLNHVSPVAVQLVVRALATSPTALVPKQPVLGTAVSRFDMVVAALGDDAGWADGWAVAAHLSLHRERSTAYELGSIPVIAVFDAANVQTVTFTPVQCLVHSIEQSQPRQQQTIRRNIRASRQVWLDLALTMGDVQTMSLVAESGVQRSFTRHQCLAEALATAGACVDCDGRLRQPSPLDKTDADECHTAAESHAHYALSALLSDGAAHASVHAPRLLSHAVYALGCATAAGRGIGLAAAACALTAIWADTSAVDISDRSCTLMDLLALAASHSVSFVELAVVASLLEWITIDTAGKAFRERHRIALAGTSEAQVGKVNELWLSVANFPREDPVRLRGDASPASSVRTSISVALALGSNGVQSFPVHPWRRAATLMGYSQQARCQEFLAAHVAENPQDGEAWAILALLLARPPDSAGAIVCDDNISFGDGDGDDRYVQGHRRRGRRRLPDGALYGSVNYFASATHVSRNVNDVEASAVTIRGLPCAAADCAAFALHCQTSADRCPAELFGALACLLDPRSTEVVAIGEGRFTRRQLILRAQSMIATRNVIQQLAPLVPLPGPPLMRAQPSWLLTPDGSRWLEREACEASALGPPEARLPTKGDAESTRHQLTSDLTSSERASNPLLRDRDLDPKALASRQRMCGQRSQSTSGPSLDDDGDPFAQVGRVSEAESRVSSVPAQFEPETRSSQDPAWGTMLDLFRHRRWAQRQREEGEHAEQLRRNFADYERRQRLNGIAIPPREVKSYPWLDDTQQTSSDAEMTAFAGSRRAAFDSKMEFEIGIKPAKRVGGYAGKALYDVPAGYKFGGAKGAPSTTDPSPGEGNAEASPAVTPAGTQRRTEVKPLGQLDEVVQRSQAEAALASLRARLTGA
jgi:hypothetical protein